MKKVLLIEDEAHKQQELTDCIVGCYPRGVDIQHVDSVHAAYWAVTSSSYDLIVLDMALPTFSAEDGGAERGFDQPEGGLEVLRALRASKVRTRIIIVTQYPEISVGEQRLSLHDAVAALSTRYEQDVVGGIVYKYRSSSYIAKLSDLLKKMV